MASTFQSNFHGPSHSPAHGISQRSAPGAIPILPIAAPPAGTFPPGTVIRVGSHKCSIERYLSEGGFAHVYLVKVNQVVDGTDVAVLKRVAVPDKEALTSMRVEVETMKRLKGHRHIVTYIDSHASQMKGGGYEVFLLMEFCAGGGLIDFMNTRLQNRLTEPEILKIFMDVSEGVACMHYLVPPLLHRDLKIENILITPNPRKYKLCDFGSCAEVRLPGKSTAECRLIEEDIQKHTTLQYRSPEMIDVYKGLPIDEKSDIWALGVLLYKLCYYTTPFEDQGQLAILNASYKFPQYPVFSDQLKQLISSMLREDPRLRPNIYHVVKEVCRQRGTDIPIQDIYSGKNAQERRQIVVAVPPSVTSQPAASQGGAALVREKPLPAIKPTAPEIVQMRRGRPPKPDESRESQPSRSPAKRPVADDPFAALDQPLNSDELSSRFPSVEQFSLLHDSGNKFDFRDFPSASDNEPKDLNTRVMERLADNAFTVMPMAPEVMAGNEVIQQKVLTGNAGQPTGKQYIRRDQDSKPAMVSQGTMTGPLRASTPHTTVTAATQTLQDLTLDTPDSLSRFAKTNPAMQYPKPMRPGLADHRSSSHSNMLSLRNQTEQIRPSSAIGSRGTSSPRIPAMHSRPRPSSTHIESNIDFLRDLDSGSKNLGSRFGQSPLILHASATGQSMSSVHSEHIESNVDFLRALQQESESIKGIKQEKRAVSVGAPAKHSKKASITSMNLSNTKNLLAGKFGEAFRKFELPGSEGRRGGRSPNPQDDELSTSYDKNDKDVESLEITSHDVPAEMRREMEKRQLADEERRVAAAAAEYKRNLKSREPGRPIQRTRAGSIQRKVQALLDDENRLPVVRVAEGYGKYTDTGSNRPDDDLDGSSLSRARTVAQSNPSDALDKSSQAAAIQNNRTLQRPTSAQEAYLSTRQPVVQTINPRSNNSINPYNTQPSSQVYQSQIAQNISSSGAPTINSRTGGMPPPRPRPKPESLRNHIPISADIKSSRDRSRPHIQSLNYDLNPISGVSKMVVASPLDSSPYPAAAPVEGDDLSDFKQRYPSLSGLDL